MHTFSFVVMFSQLKLIFRAAFAKYNLHPQNNIFNVTKSMALSLYARYRVQLTVVHTQPVQVDSRGFDTGIVDHVLATSSSTLNRSVADVHYEDP